jgi:hypothetical protein
MASFGTAADIAASPAASAGVPLFRLYLLRALYLMVAIFLLTGVAPLLAQPAPTLMTGAARALFVGLGLLALLGLRYPLQMLPLMLFEVAWKSVWLAAYGLPLWSAGRLDADHAQTFQDTGIGIIIALLVIPWGYVWRQYVRRPGDRWR